MTTIHYEALEKMDTTPEGTDALELMLNCMVDELTERRKVQDPRLFRYCFWFATPKDGRFPQIIDNFCDLAAEAFKNYHDYRSKGATLDENGQLVIPDPAPDTGLGGTAPEDDEDAPAGADDTGAAPDAPADNEDAPAEQDA